MRRKFWDEAFGRGSGDVLPVGDPGEEEAQELPEGITRVRFPGPSGKEQPLVTMCRLTSVQGASVFWMAEAVLAWLNGLLDRHPETGARGLEAVYLRAAPPRGGQDPVPVCPVHRACLTGISQPPQGAGSWASLHRVVELPRPAERHLRKCGPARCHGVFCSPRSPSTLASA
jgi:hypothetical protein